MIVMMIIKPGKAKTQTGDRPRCSRRRSQRIPFLSRDDDDDEDGENDDDDDDEDVDDDDDEDEYQVVEVIKV